MRRPKPASLLASSRKRIGSDAPHFVACIRAGELLESMFSGAEFPRVRGGLTRAIETATRKDKPILAAVQKWAKSLRRRDAALASKLEPLLATLPAKLEAALRLEGATNLELADILRLEDPAGRVHRSAKPIAMTWTDGHSTWSQTFASEDACNQFSRANLTDKHSVTYISPVG